MLNRLNQLKRRLEMDPDNWLLRAKVANINVRLGISEKLVVGVRHGVGPNNLSVWHWEEEFSKRRFTNAHARGFRQSHETPWERDARGLGTETNFRFQSGLFYSEDPNGPWTTQLIAEHMTAASKGQRVWRNVGNRLVCHRKFS